MPERAGLCTCGHPQNEHDEAGHGICENDGPCPCVQYTPHGEEVGWA